MNIEVAHPFERTGLFEQGSDAASDAEGLFMTGARLARIRYCEQFAQIVMYLGLSKAVA